MNVLVTGGAGYVGSHVCKALALAGYTPIVYDNLINGDKQAVKWGPIEIGDINDRQRLDAVIKKYEPQAVMHFAAYAYVGESVVDPAKYFRNNFVGTLTLLESMCSQGVKKLVFSSTCATYGIPKIVPINENHPQRPINPYGKSKLMIEQMLHDFYRAYDLQSISLRYFNAAGADPDGELGESHEPETHLIPLLLEAAVGQRSEFTIFGNDYDTHDGTCVRDYIHVSDLADAHVLALRELEHGCDTRFYNLGNGVGFSVLEVLKMVEYVTNKTVKYSIVSRRDGDPASLIGDATKIKSIGWKPKHGDLLNIVSSAYDWLCSQKNK